jgi:hypothetical protein
MYSKATLAFFAALTATVSVAALPASYPAYVDLAERDFGYDNADLVERDYYDNADLVERDFYDMDFEELAARQEPSAPPVDPSAAQAPLAAPPTPVSSAPSPGQGRPHGHGHGHGVGHHGHGHGHGHGQFHHPAHHYKADGTLKSKSGRRRANRKHRKAQEAAAAAAAAQPPVPQAGGDPNAAQMAPPVSPRELVLEERGLLETLGLKARVATLTVNQTTKMNKAKTVCDGLTSKKDKKKCHKSVDKIIQLSKERNYDVEQFIKITNHHDVFTNSDPNASPASSASTPSPSSRT